MSQRTLPGDPPVELTLRRSTRARRISLRVSGLDGKVTLTLPQGTPEAQALQFAQAKGEWLRAQLHRQPAIAAICPGSTLPVEGRPTTIALGPVRRIEYESDTLVVPGPASTLAARLEGWLKARARDRLVCASDRFAKGLGREYTRISLRDTRSRWGSCSAEGRLMYSWRLILAPPDVLDYVAAHEVAHLKEMNHSSAFWSTVATLMPAYDAPRHWLRQHGAELHRYRFRA
ncbi:MAG: SprT family zinc-dependent metalloprotease [Pseudomonadota bacterium]